jgi:hypothetical protein
VRTGSVYCYFHDPAAAAERVESRRKGGRERSQRATTVAAEDPDPPLTSLANVSALLADTICRVRKGTLDAKLANTVGYLAGILIRSIEGGEMEHRLAVLEAAVRDQGGVYGEGTFDRPVPLLEECR